MRLCFLLLLPPAETAGTNVLPTTKQIISSCFSFVPSAWFAEDQSIPLGAADALFLILTWSIGCFLTQKVYFLQVTASENKVLAAH